MRSRIAACPDGLGLFGERSYEKLASARVFAAPNDHVQLFLKHLWGGRGLHQMGEADYLDFVSERIRKFG
jgi:hypothetical protein